MNRIDLGTMAYCEAWAEQERAHAEVLAGGEERVFFVEHPPVITLGRRPGLERNLVASAEHLKRIGVELMHSDRGGDITFHGPGQLVAYPIVRLNDHGLSVGSYVRKLQEAAIATLAEFGVAAQRDTEAIGVWARRREDDALAKICAVGVRIRRGVSTHGIALNVTTDLSYFDLIVPCGLQGRPVTSLHALLGAGTPSMEEVRDRLGAQLNHHLIEQADRRRVDSSAR
jgi:lipoate-protein ligase B